ncbi:hypothetical protein [Tunicatimonas pelagia]|uniref:hypothetical protein n=1 Tax=Tunicatimonas pelagia TaxID=931531 RepID=UPI0026663982|nr:hypothetical protein [Tunicatimonas pelagia]WKN40785.1 hypothetical protein P0M28_17245 [Tunicatimonas pelagia]
MISCSSDAESGFAINFCESYEVDDNCRNSENTFKLGSPVYVHFTSDEPLEGNVVIGRILRIAADGSEYELGLKQFDLEPETTYLIQSIPFQNFGTNALGTFLIEFSNETGQVLADRELIITE